MWDWSSAVCSSDLVHRHDDRQPRAVRGRGVCDASIRAPHDASLHLRWLPIGRASWGGRGEGCGTGVQPCALPILYTGMTIDSRGPSGGAASVTLRYGPCMTPVSIFVGSRSEERRGGEEGRDVGLEFSRVLFRSCTPA